MIKRTQRKSITFWKFFFSYTLVAIFLCLLAFGYLQYQQEQDQLAWLEKENQRSMQNTLSYIQEITQNSGLNAGQLTKIDWVNKLITPITAEELNHLPYTERLRMTKNALFASRELGDIFFRQFLIFPYQDLCVGWNSWLCCWDYFGVLGVPEEDRNELKEKIQALTETTYLWVSAVDTKEGKLLLCSPVESIAHSRAYMVSVVDAYRLEKQLSDRMIGAVQGVEIRDSASGHLLMAAGKVHQGDEIQQEAGSLQFTFYLNAALISTLLSPAGSILWMGLILGLAILLCYAIAVMTYRPLGKMVSRVGGQSDGIRRSDYGIVENALDALENQIMLEKHSNGLHRLLNGLFVQDEAEFREWRLSFRDQGLFQVLIVTVPEDKGAFLSGIGAILSAFPGVQQEHTHLDGQECVFILNYPVDAEAEKDSRAIIQRLREAGMALRPGTLNRGLLGISISYQSARTVQSENDKMQGAICYFPFAWEKQLITALREGNEKTAGRIWQELRKENERLLVKGMIDEENILNLHWLIISDVKRVAAETHQIREMRPIFHHPEKGASMDSLWQQVEAACHMLCALIGPGERPAVPGKAAPDIIGYIRKHFTEHDMCLKRLEDEFHISYDTINKIIKEQTSSSFLNFITDLRVRQAKELLMAGQMTIPEVAASVGYDNDYSFRRVFFRVTGIKAQDFGRKTKAAPEETAEKSDAEGSRETAVSSAPPESP